ncbi:hypothetical protein D3C86_1518820 [compost metagenome]
MLTCHISRSSTVGAHQTSTPLAYMAVRSSGIMFSQHTSAPIRPTRLSITGKVEPSPLPQISRSVPVGISLRCFATNPACGSKYNAEQYKVLPARSMTPITRLAPVRADKPANVSVSAPGTSMALAK